MRTATATPPRTKVVGRRLRNEQNLAEVLVGAHVLVAGLGLGERIGLLDRELDAAGLDVIPQVGAHLDQDFAHLLDGAAAEGDADVVGALARVSVEVELGLPAREPSHADYA